MNFLDMMGQPSPIPVVQVQAVLTGLDAFGVVVAGDNMTEVRNLEKMARDLGCRFSLNDANPVI